MLSRSPILTKFNEQSLALIIIGHNSAQLAPPSVTYFFLLASRTLYTPDFLPTSHWSLLHLLCCIFPFPCPLKDRAPETQSLVFSSPSTLLHPPLMVSSSFKILNNICMQMILMYISIPDHSLKYRLVFPTDYATSLFGCLIGISKLIYKTKLTSLFSLPNLLHPWHSSLNSVHQAFQNKNLRVIPNSFCFFPCHTLHPISQKICCLYLQNISGIRSAFTTFTTTSLIWATIPSHLGYWNGLLISVPVTILALHHSFFFFKSTDF